MKRAFALASVLGVFGLAVAAGSAAAPGPTPNNQVGACNMMSAVFGYGPGNGVGVQPGGGMDHAMTVNNPNGNAGMYNAVFRTGGTC